MCLKRLLGVTVLALSPLIRSTSNKSTSVFPVQGRYRLLSTNNIRLMALSAYTPNNDIKKLYMAYCTGIQLQVCCVIVYPCGQSATPGHLLAAPCWPFVLPWCYSAPFLQPEKGIWSQQPGQQVVLHSLGLNCLHASDLQNKYRVNY